MNDSSDALYLGLISGTSMDGVDAALVRRRGAGVELLAARNTPYPSRLNHELLNAASGQGSCETLGVLDVAVGDVFAHAAASVLEAAGVDAGTVTAIGSHGQTLLHRPERGFSLQIGDPARIALATGITTVADFRRADLAAGGEGAPLAPVFHRAVFAQGDETRAVLNLGGISNLTLLQPGAPVLAFDVGPANTLSDALLRDTRGEAFDRDGALAAAGRVDPALLEALLADPWFERPPPKSTGPELFNLAWVRRRAPADLPGSADLAATFAELLAASVQRALQGLGTEPARLYCCGGGVHNPELMRRLAAALPGTTVATTADLGVDPDWVEAMCFAWLAGETLAGRPGNLPSVTGARQAVVLGSVHRP